MCWAAAVVLTGGIVIPLGFAVLRSRATTRALVVAAVFFLAYAVSDFAAFRAGAGRVSGRLHALAPVLAVLVALVLVGHAVRFGTYTAGSADSYGYVNQAYDWARGKLPSPEPLALSLPFPSSDLIQTPLGYRPGPKPHTMVPTYAPGLPMIMAVALAAGPCGPFLVVPLAAGLFVVVTYALGTKLGGRGVGLVAAFLVTSSPIVLYQSEWPMSDVPAGALWTAALLAALGTTRMRAAAAGLLTALGLFIRPNLLPLVVVPLGCMILMTRGFGERARRAVLFALPIVISATTIAWLNAMWYGSPLRSGYGTNEELYSILSVWPNLQRYPVWLWQSQSPFVLFAIVPFVPWLSPPAIRRAVWPAALMAGATLLCYLAYFPFEAWWYLRFLLPGFGAFAVLTAAGLIVVARRVPAPWGHIALLLCLMVIAEHTFMYGSRAGVFGTLSGERRYVAAAAYARTLPPDTVIFTMQHSGSVRFYGGRYSLRYDLLDKDSARRASVELERIGLHPYLLIDDWEGPYVQHQFGLPDGPLPWPLAARLREFGGVSVYDLATTPASSSPVAIDSITSPLCPSPAPLVVQPRPR